MVSVKGFLFVRPRPHKNTDIFKVYWIASLPVLILLVNVVFASCVFVQYISKFSSHDGECVDKHQSFYS